MSETTHSSTPQEVGGQEAAPQIAKGSNVRPRLRLALVGVILLLAVGFLLIKGLGSSLDYFKTVKQAKASETQLGATVFRLEGIVEPGTISQTTLGARFTLTQGTSSIQVVNQGSPPQLFKATMPVIVVGHFAANGSGVFESNQIMVKHSASYIAQHPGRVTAGDGSKN
jgi:cytochrome c-type biogenesis protein CcmE